ncbi:spore germination protein [Paenibacillus apiarius]|uniref:Spore germination protein n=1 Tax=Paenibacillus apiarius TaxID=46240 RepID=A0ABT4DQ09_9BACL|nr:spore germination protein [Paenibacillus apiarius]MCY9515607.1 spore germination protein [Paenibacillus apiarius]MCY9519320.1 spore germination protein [Paenibacillus apiarius]MCY9550956.1 spore germination protein [Paenibacillus apiarius]MCY9558952.1 spore germination protein [Paenibacillus apiarius]MCY9683571.1 spore germination protein [Paenibacillus apiarius]
MAAKESLTTYQAAVLVSNFILGVGILTLPRTATEKVKTPDIWLSVIIGGLIAMLAGVIIVKLSQQFPEKTFYEYSEHIVGKWLGCILNLVVIGYFVATSSHMVRALAEVTTLFLLEGTPHWAIIMAFMWVGLYLVIGGLPAIARLFEIIFPITVIIFFMIAVMSLKIFDVNNLRPVLGLGIEPALKGVKTTALSFTGFEIILVVHAYMQRPKMAAKVVLIGIAVPLLFYVTTVIMVIGALTVDGVVSRTWPTITLIQSFEFPGVFFERYESLLLVIWVMQIFTTYVITHYAAAMGLAQVMKKDIRPFLYILLPVIYIVAMLPKNINDLFHYSDFIGNVAFVMFGVLPIVLLGIVKVRGGKT